MSSSIEEHFQPPEWATKEEVIKAAQHYINYWKIEARQRNGQWLQALDENARLKAEVERLRKAGDAMAELIESEVKHTWNRNSKLKKWEEAKEGADR